MLGDAASVAASDRAPWRALPAFVDRYEQALRDRGRIDYGRVLADAVRLAEQRPDVASAYRVVIADEYQDTSLEQHALIEPLLEEIASDPSGARAAVCPAADTHADRSPRARSRRPVGPAR